MFQQTFINRKNELEILEERFTGSKPEFLVMYGRRRVGKTELVTHFLNRRQGIYFLAEEKRYMDNLNDMKEVMSDFLMDDEFKIMGFKNWVQLFKSFSERLKERTIIVIDEFPYLVRENKGIPSEFQKIWDMYLNKNNRIMLIIVGSSIGMMEELLARKSPLFGRRTAQLEIKPVDLFQASEFLPDYAMTDCIKAYGCLDGIPLYLKQFDHKLTIYENMENAFFRRDALLYSEAEILLKQEFREPANYFAILKAISFGKTKQNEIVNYTDIDKSIISKYIQNLEEIRIIRKEYPVDEKKEMRKNARYTFSDNYFRFWFRFIYPRRTLIERSSPDAINTLKNNYNRYMGYIFEQTAKDFPWNRRPFDFGHVGRWWHKDIEIDLVALNEELKEIFFFECKWKSLREGDARKIIFKLKGKSGFVKWNKHKRNEFFGLFAKHVENKCGLRKEGLFVFDLDDFK